MFDVFVSFQDVFTGEIHVSSFSIDNLSRCLSDCMKCVVDDLSLLSFHALFRSSDDQGFVKADG